MDGDCYVPFPLQHTSGSTLSWYQARRTCWHFGGDLAPSRAVLNLTSSSWPETGNRQFSIGLFRDEYVWHDTKGISRCLLLLLLFLHQRYSILGQKKHQTTF